MKAAAAFFAAALAVVAAHAAGPRPPELLSATLSAPTDRYGHDVLGGNEYAQLTVAYRPGGAGAVVEETITLPEARVFEDVEARVADLTGDGFPEVIVVEASRSGGAELAVYGFPGRIDTKASTRQLEGGAFARIAATPPIGRRNRWLAPAGIADFDGDGRDDVAYVETPHIGGTLRLWTLRDGLLVEIASAPGYSNHRIGEDFITGGVRDCGEGPELVLPQFGWGALMAVRLENRTLTGRVIGEAADPESVNAALACGTE